MKKILIRVVTLILFFSTVTVVILNKNNSDLVSKKYLDSKNNPLKEVTLKFFFPGEDRKAKDQVLKYLYEATKDKLNAKFQFNFIPFGDYANKITMMTAAGDNFDASLDNTKNFKTGICMERGYC